MRTERDQVGVGGLSAALVSKGDDVQPSQGASADIIGDLMTRIARERDREAFSMLFRAMAPRVGGYLRSLGVRDGSADDLLQDVMLTIWRRAHQFDPARATASTWIFTIARNRRIDVLRRERRPQIDPDDPTLAGTPPPAADAIMTTRETGEQVRQAIGHLPPEQASLLRMAFFDDKSHSLIADELGIPLGTVKSRLRLAAAKLRDRLEAPE